VMEREEKERDVNMVMAQRKRSLEENTIKILLTYRTVFVLRDLPRERLCVDSSFPEDGDARLVLRFVDCFQLLAREQRIRVCQPSLIFGSIEPQRSRVSLFRLWQRLEIRFPERSRSIDILQHQIEEANGLDLECIPALAEHWIFIIGQSVQIGKCDRMRNCSKSRIGLDGFRCSPVNASAAVVDDVDVWVEIATRLAAKPIL
jgi:hypothetical protein